jgi:hypothetical protein
MCKWILLTRRVSLCLGDWLASSHWRALWLQATPIPAHAPQCNLYDDHNQTNEFVHIATNSNVTNNRTLSQNLPNSTFVRTSSMGETYKDCIRVRAVQNGDVAMALVRDLCEKKSLQLIHVPKFSSRWLLRLFSGLKLGRNWRRTQHVPLKRWYPFTMLQGSNNLFHFQLLGRKHHTL